MPSLFPYLPGPKRRTICIRPRSTLLKSLYAYQKQLASLGTALQTRRSRVQFHMVSLEFFIDIILQPHYGPGIDTASNRNEYQEYFLVGGWGVNLAPCGDRHEIWEPQPPGTLWACPGLSMPVMGLLYLDLASVITRS